MNISSIRYRWRDALLRLSADQLGLLFLWISLLIQARFESQRWLRALESGALQPVRREEILIVLSLVTFVGQMVDTPRNVARAIMQGPPMKDWPYLRPGSGAKVKHNEKMRSDDA